MLFKYFLTSSSNQLNLSSNFKGPSLAAPCSEFFLPLLLVTYLSFPWIGHAFPPCMWFRWDFLPSPNPSGDMWPGLRQTVCSPPLLAPVIGPEWSRDLDQSAGLNSEILVNRGDVRWKLPAINVMRKVACNGANPEGSRAETSRGTMSWWSCLVPESSTPEARDTVRPFSYAVQWPHSPSPSSCWSRVCVTHNQVFQQIQSLLFTNSQKSGATWSTQPRSETPLVPWRPLPELPVSS